VPPLIPEEETIELPLLLTAWQAVALEKAAHIATLRLDKCFA